MIQRWEMLESFLLVKEGCYRNVIAGGGGGGGIAGIGTLGGFGGGYAWRMVLDSFCSCSLIWPTSEASWRQWWQSALGAACWG